jgi:putative transposase
MVGESTGLKTRHYRYAIRFAIVTVNRRVARLASGDYVGKQSYFVTVCCNRRAPHLGEPATAQRVIALLRECAAGHAFLLHAFCLMPDHAHVLVEGTHERSDLREFVRLFKQRSGFEFRKSRGEPLWEMSYYDHILRPAEQIEDVACYIWWNPVRKGLCSQPCEFPFTGSQTIEWMKRSLVGTAWRAPWRL